MFIANIFLANIYSVLLFIEPQTHEKKDTLLSVEPGLMIWTIVIFVLLVFILKKFAWGPLLQSLKNREMGIKDSIEKAEILKQESEKLLARNRELLAKADEEARKVIAEGKDMAEKLRNDIINKTHDDAARMLHNAKTEIEREKVAALNELRDEVANLAVQA
ncbi:MAG TPA: F0F1 ATP synthase subunit B, partial [Ignavibacteria bacterium]